MTVEVEKEYLDELEYELKELKIESEKLKEKIYSLKETNYSLSKKIENELEPRIRAEERAYDNYVLTDHAAEAEGCFCYYVDELVDMVRNNERYFVFGDCDGDIYAQILYLIQNLQSEVEK